MSASQIASYISLIAWLFAQLPQVIANFRNGSVEGLSLGFLGIWFLGDFCNFVGCVLTHQMGFQRALATYYLLVDCVLGAQYWYYTVKARREQRKEYMGIIIEEDPDHEDEEVTEVAPLMIPKTRAASFGNMKGLVTASFLASFSKAYAASIPTEAVVSSSSSSSSDLLFAIGTAISYICAVLYLTSRLPQIYTNFCRKSTSGTSILLFMSALTGNVTYTLSILLADPPSGISRGMFLLNELPFLMGAAGTVVFDVIIMTQWFMYKERVIDTSNTGYEPL